jgi:hypothetical protein
MDIRRTLRIAAAAATAALVVVLVVVLSQSRHHRSGSNGAPPVTEVALPPGHELCQAGEFFPEGTARTVLHPHDEGGVVGPLTVTVNTKDGERLAEGQIAARDYQADDTAVATFEPVGENTVDAVVCIRNEGEVAGALRGDAQPEQGGAALLIPGPNPGEPPYIRMRFDYELPEASTWWSFAPELAERFGLVKATFFGSWTMWVTLAALFALALGTVWWAARALAR